MSESCFKRCSLAKNCVKNVQDISELEEPTLQNQRQQRFGEFLLAKVNECQPEITGSGQYCLLNRIVVEDLVRAISSEQ